MIIKSWIFVFLIVLLIISWLLLFQVCVRKGRVDPFVIAVTARAQFPPWTFSNVDRCDNSSVPTFLLEIYFAQITGIEKEGFCEIHTRHKGQQDGYVANKNGRSSKTSICHICEFA